MPKKLLTFISCLLILSLAIVGCSGQGADQEVEGNTGSSNTSAAPDRPFVYLAQQVIGSMDPAKHTDETEMIAVLNTYDPLVYPKIEEGSMEPGPHIAESWSVSEDGLTYTFKIREGIEFHSGNPLTADDVVFSIQRMISLKQGFSWLWSGVLELENVKATDPYTVEFTLNNAYAPFVSTLTQLFIVDSQTLLANKESGSFGENGDYGQKYLENNVAGSGPYLVERWDRGSEIRFEKNENYWKGWEDNQIEKITMRFTPEEATVKTMLISGEADMVHQWLSEQSYEDFKTRDGIVVQEDPSVQLYHLPINTQKPPMDDINFRKAVLYAFDYEAANRQIMKGSVQAEGPVPVLVPGHNPDVVVYQKDIEKAKEYLAKSKYAGQDIEIEFMFIAERPVQRQLSILLQNNLKELGINVNLNGGPWTQITEATANVETTPHIVNIADSLKYPHVDSHTYGIYHPSARGSYRSASWYDNPETVKVLELARSSVDVEEQMKYYHEAQRLITEDAVSIYIANPPHRVAFRDYVEGYKYNGLLGYDLGFYYLSLKK